MLCIFEVWQLAGKAGQLPHLKRSVRGRPGALWASPPDNIFLWLYWRHSRQYNHKKMDQEELHPFLTYPSKPNMIAMVYNATNVACDVCYRFR